MIKNLKVARAIAEAVSILPLNKYYPPLQGNLKHVIYPQHSDLELQSDNHDTYMAYYEQVKGVDLESDNIDTVATALLANSKLNYNSTIEQDAIDILAETTRNTLNDIEHTILPIIEQYEELYSQYRNNLDVEKGLPVIIEQGLPSAITDGVITDADLTNVAIRLDKNDKLDNMVLNQEEAELAITKSGLGHVINSLLTSTNKDTLLEGYNIIAMEGDYVPRNNNVIEAINVLTYSYIVSSSLLNTPPDIISMPTSQFITNITKFRNNVAYLLRNRLEQYKRSSRFVIVATENNESGQLQVFVNKEQRKLLQDELGTRSSADVILGHVLSTKRSDRVITSDYQSLVDRADSLIQVTRNTKAVTENINRTTHSNELRRYLRDLLAIDETGNITEDEKDEYHNEIGNPDRVAIATDIINKLTEEQLLDDYNSVIIDIVCKSRFPYTPAISYIKAMLQEEANNPEASRHELLLYAIIELWSETLVASFSQ